MFKRRIKNENGAVTIEAMIALTAFLFAFIMIYSIITLCRAQARIQIALNDTAQEISQYRQHDGYLDYSPLCFRLRRCNNYRLR